MRNLLLLSAFCLALSTASRADTVFGLVNNTYEGGGSATGTVTIDTLGGTFTSVDIVFTMGSNTYLFSGVPEFQTAFDNNTQYFEYKFDSGGNALTIDIPGASLVGYMGGPLCSGANLCGDGYEGALLLADGVSTYGALTGSLATTPEPSSVILLGTGLLSAAAAVRRKALSHGV